MKIFVYTNKIVNYVSGQYYFIAAERRQADVMAERFRLDKYNNCDGNRNYIVEWEDHVAEWEIKPGYISLNRG